MARLRPTWLSFQLTPDTCWALRMPFSPSPWLLMTALLFAQAAGAQEDAEPDTLGEETAGESGEVDLGEDDPSEDEELTEPEPTDESVPAAEGAPADAAEADDKRKDGSKQLLIGLRHRMIIVPKFLINSFGLDGGRTFVTQGFGGEVGGYFGESDNGVMVLGSVWYAPYHLKPTVWKKKKDDDSQWEVVESDLNSVYLTLDALWDFRIIERLSINVGMGVGIGIVTGNLYRNETYQGVNPQTGSYDYPAKDNQPPLSKCLGPFNPSPACPADGDYGESERWPVYPWLNFQWGLRWQPVDSFIARLDMGIGSSGFWLGFGGDYSLWL